MFTSIYSFGYFVHRLFLCLVTTVGHRETVEKFCSGQRGRRLGVWWGMVICRSMCFNGTSEIYVWPKSDSGLDFKVLESRLQKSRDLSLVIAWKSLDSSGFISYIKLSTHLSSSKWAMPWPNLQEQCLLRMIKFKLLFKFKVTQIPNEGLRLTHLTSSEAKSDLTYILILLKVREPK